MVAEAQRKYINTLNSLSSFIYGLKTQLGDQDGLGGKLSEENKKMILNTIKDTTERIDENGSNASTEEDLEEKLASIFFCCHIICELLTSEVHGVANPISSKLYSSDAPHSLSVDDDILCD
jgi:heat shock protein 5